MDASNVAKVSIKKSPPSNFTPLLEEGAEAKRFRMTVQNFAHFCISAFDPSTRYVFANFAPAPLSFVSVSAHKLASV